MWNHIVVEAFCTSWGTDLYSCGKKSPGNFCLGDGDGHCPYLAWGDSNCREAAWFVPFKYILKDKIQHWIETIYTNLHFYLYYKWFKLKKDIEWLHNIPSIECPEVDEECRSHCEQFIEWMDRR